jgi:hypothetical protein
MRTSFLRWVPQVSILRPGKALTLVCLVIFLLPVFLQAQTAAPASATSKRPMTFEDMMQMKRLGETAVSKDGKWLAYSVTSVDLEKNTKTPELWLQKIEGGAPFKIAVAQPGDSGAEFAPDGSGFSFSQGARAASRSGSPISIRRRARRRMHAS